MAVVDFSSQTCLTGALQCSKTVGSSRQVTGVYRTSNGALIGAAISHSSRTAVAAATRSKDQGVGASVTSNDSTVGVDVDSSDRAVDVDASSSDLMAAVAVDSSNLTGEMGRGRTGTVRWILFPVFPCNLPSSCLVGLANARMHEA